MKLRVNNVRVFLAQENSLQEALCRKLAVPLDAVRNIRVLRKAVDAREKRDICLNYHLTAELELSRKQVKRLTANKDVSEFVKSAVREIELGRETLSGRPVVIGSGPAGLMAAVQLARYGYKPLLLERGRKLARRVADVYDFWTKGVFDPISNVQFGAGGAGTFSDGKLTTRVNDSAMEEILRLFTEAGAPENIMWEHKPHIGTDRLRIVVEGLIGKLKELGGNILYEAHVVDMQLAEGAVFGIKLASGENMKTGVVVLACGHSARDTYEMLYRRGIGIIAKPFSIGVRIEHPQDLIDRAQYGIFAGHPLLGAADYALVHHTEYRKRTVYSFCMCPGGEVVAAASEPGGVAVNGMSMYKRDSGVANSALVVNVSSSDYGGEPLAGIEFQRRYEKLAFCLGGAAYNAPAQNVGSFIRRTEPSLQSLVRPTYRPGLKACRLDDVLPSYVTDTIRAGLISFSGKIAGFADEGALLTGVETRTSAPVRIVRNPESFTSVSHDLLYPCGEGAGYAGGIMSAALDGYHTARKIIERFAPPA